MDISGSNNTDSFTDNSVVYQGEEEAFLSGYSIENYARPSVTADIAVFGMYGEESDSHRKDSVHKLSLLLVKRGEHPFKGRWALPGGFMRMDETLEECAARELFEESGIIPTALLPIGTFSAVDRDPRGRVISNAFVSVVGEEDVKPVGGDDAVDARWFDVDFDYKDGVFRLELSCDEELISATLNEKGRRFGAPVFEPSSTDSGLAFDHARIIATALCVLRREAQDFDIVFDFLPECFTLALLQRVQETLMGVTFLTANYRRKIAPYVEETDEFTEGVGHRPARLFKRREK